MGSLGLVGDKATRRIGDLSGGEKARVALATFCLQPSNVLLLDEPTNHLDAEAIAALLEAIDEYEGAIVVVSHDRAFCEAIACTHVGYVANGACIVEERSLRDKKRLVRQRRPRLRPTRQNARDPHRAKRENRSLRDAGGPQQSRLRCRRRTRTRRGFSRRRRNTTRLQGLLPPSEAQRAHAARRR